MSTEIIQLYPKTSIWMASVVFLENKIDGVPVVDDDKLIGLFTKTHLIKAIKNKESMDIPIDRYMTRDIEVLSPYDNILSINITSYGCYPVIENGELVGIITRYDMLVALNYIIDEISDQIYKVSTSVYITV
ncbi:CBS domain-containing protein [Candidatus Syntrophocurvum alkaliphilum]|uniref:CBS domain-containing protein n=1 Tax=Candidatus Syntrophocurvum alkaliphilum TaxID=2293317 RepID=UPI0012E27F02|nr:CBS domain-containing protein [Candidatus Syntrophocurvum alkaliphilum]